MAVKRRKAQSKRPRRPDVSRVLKLTTETAWQKLQQNHKDSLIIIHFSGSFSNPSAQLRPYFAMYARLPQYSHVTFAEIDVDQLSNVAESIGVTACPTIVCWRDGKLVQISGKNEGGNPSFIRQMLEAHAGDKPSGPRWRSWLVKALVTAGAIAATMAVVRSTKKRDDPDKRAAAVHDQIETLQKSMNLAKRRKQQRTLKQLAGRMDRLTAEAKALDQLARQQNSSQVQLQPARGADSARRAQQSASDDDDADTDADDDDSDESEAEGSCSADPSPPLKSVAVNDQDEYYSDTSTASSDDGY